LAIPIDLGDSASEDNLLGKSLISIDFWIRWMKILEWILISLNFINFKDIILLIFTKKVFEMGNGYCWDNRIKEK
jgi:hypothetical protein